MYIKTVCALIAGAIAFTSPAYAQIAAYNGSGTTADNSNADLNLGRTFRVSGSGINVSALGIFDLYGNGLVNDHTVTLFSNNGNTVLGSVNVASGTAAQFLGGFRYTDLTTPLYLAPGNYSIIGYGFNSSRDAFANGGGKPIGGSTNVTDGGFDPYQFTSAASPAYPTGGDSGNHSSASFLFTVAAVPEPAAWAMMILGMGMIGFVMRRRNVTTRVSYAA